jgi:hypothetical protein
MRGIELTIADLLPADAMQVGEQRSETPELDKLRDQLFGLRMADYR